MSTLVVHCQKSPFDVYIGRGVPRRNMKPSPWGNPFKVGRDHTREQAVAAFKEWFHHSPDPEAVWMREHVHELRGKRLGCWCFPNECHGSVLAAAAEAGQ